MPILGENQNGIRYIKRRKTLDANKTACKGKDTAQAEEGPAGAAKAVYHTASVRQRAVGKEKAAREISELKVYRAVKRMKPPADEMVITSGSTVLYGGRWAVVRGVANKGKTLLLEGYEQHVPARECKLLTRNSGMVCL